MRRVVECVPNFSEGRDKSIIDEIVAPISEVNGVKLLNVEPNEDYNRVVVTFAGEPEGVLEAAFLSSKKAIELIDMTKHKGEHPRIGAVDVVPFVPVKGVTMGDCVELSNKFAKLIAQEFGLPVYLYEESARDEKRKSLANIRAGEYEGLQEKLKDPDWQPDYGPAAFVPRSGAVVTGARFFLIAYNVNLNTKDKGVA
ncbi:MAG: glutamate formimidoyltransferase, partial [bacterium]